MPKARRPGPENNERGDKLRPGELVTGELRRRVLELTELRRSGPIDLMLEFFAPDVVVHCHSSKEGLFPPLILRGKAALSHNMRMIDADFEPRDGEILDILIENQTAVVRWRNAWRHRATGRERMFDMAHFMRWENGLVVEMFEYLDYHGMAALAQR